MGNQIATDLRCRPNAFLSIAAAALSLLMSYPALADIIDFTGPFAPGTWVTTFVGDVNPAGPTNDGSVSATPASVTLTGGNDPGDVIGCTSGLFSCEIRFTHSTVGFS